MTLATRNYIFHSFLCVIEPRRRRIQVIDSGRKTYLWNAVVRDWVRLLEIFLGKGDDDSSDGEEGDGEKGQGFDKKEWMVKVGVGPTGVGQGKARTCALHSTTNAMCLAFGYPVTELVDRDIDIARRFLFARELMNGHFDRVEGERFWYPVFEETEDRDGDGWLSVVEWEKKTEEEGEEEAGGVTGWQENVLGKTSNTFTGGQEKDGDGEDDGVEE